MTDFPAQAGLHEMPVFTSMSGMIWDAVLICGTTGPIAAVWPAQNRAIYCPIYVIEPVLAKQLACYNGTTINGNIDLGIYTEWGTKIISTGQVAHAGSGVVQLQDITDTWLNPGAYYLAMSSSSATATFFRSLPDAQIIRSCGMQQQASAATLPATATFAAITSNYVPFITLVTQTVL